MGILFIVIGLILLITAVGLASLEKDLPSYKEVKCYDKFSNEIVGATCLERDADVNPYIITFCVLTAFFILGGIFIIESDTWQN